MTTDLITANGRLLFEPRGLHGSVPRSRGWAVIETSLDWYNLVAEDARLLLRGSWQMVLDPERAPGGHRRDVGITPRPAFVRPRVQLPAWGPHISISRGERARKNRDQWDLLVERTKHLLNRDASIYFLGEQRARKASNHAMLQEVENKGGTHARKARDRYRKVIAECDRAIRYHVKRVRAADREVPRIEDRLRSKGAPEFLFEPFTFTFDPADMRWWRKHFAVNVECPRALEVRGHFGMSRRTKQPLHMTMVVKG